MSIFRYCKSRTGKITKPLDKATFDAIKKDDLVRLHCDAAREADERGDEEAYEKNKIQLPVAF